MEKLNKKPIQVVRTSLTILEERMGYSFNDKSLLELALTHRSLRIRCNERLEFLGDAVLGLVMSDYLYEQDPDMNEGNLSCIRSNLVSKSTLVECADDLDLFSHVSLGLSERKGTTARSRNSVMADALEALIGAVYLDGGLGPCRDMIVRVYGNRLDNLEAIQNFKDAKSALQELVQAEYREIPLYELVSTEGKPHEQKFTVSCSLPKAIGTFIGEGTSRKEAEQTAAVEALKAIKKA